MLGNLSKAIGIIGIVFLPILVHAHTGLKETVPAADAVVAMAPEKVELVFSGPVRLIRVQVMAETLQLESDFKPNSEPTASFSIEIPEMQAGKITVTWAAMGADGHTLSDSFSFTVDAVSMGGTH